jgi:hypothetical protein
MFKKIRKYFLKNKQSLYKKAVLLALFLFVAIMFYINFILIRNLIADAVENEKITHAQEICHLMNGIDKQSDFFLDKLSQIEKTQRVLDIKEKKEMILGLRKLEGNIRETEFSYFGFYNNDLSIKFFSSQKTEADELFSQIKNLPPYGSRAVSSLEESLKLKYLTAEELDILNMEFSELKEKIKSIRENAPICQG